MVRGLTREVLSIFSWAVAAVAALYLTSRIIGARSRLTSPARLIAQIAFAVGVFIITLIIVSLITFRISDRVLDSRVGALDRTLGFIFGLLRGFLLVAIVFILFSGARPGISRPGSPTRAPIRSCKRTQVAIESLMPPNPEQYLPGGLSRRTAAPAGDAWRQPRRSTPKSPPPATAPMRRRPSTPSRAPANS